MGRVEINMARALNSDVQREREFEMPNLLPAISVILEVISTGLMSAQMAEGVSLGGLLLGAAGLVPVAVRLAGHVFPTAERFG
jgi:hypothetical protein